MAMDVTLHEDYSPFHVKGRPSREFDMMLAVRIIEFLVP